MKIFVNAYLENNLGDDLFMDILVNRYPNHEFYALTNCYETNNNNVHLIKNKYLIKIIRKFNLKPLVANKLDMAITIGGSVFMETNSKHNFSLGSNPYYILGSNFGPYKTKEYFNNAHEFFKSAEDVCFREKYSYNLFSDLSNVRCASDIIFSLDVSNVRSTNNKKVVFSIISCRDKMNSTYTENYEKAIINLAKFFVKKGYEICFMSFCKLEHDEEAIENILTKCDEGVKEKVTTYYYRGNRKEAIEILADSQIIIGGRFHANILGMVLGKTVIPMMYSDKTKNVLEDMKYEGKIIDIRNLQDFDASSIIKEKDLQYKQDISFQIKDAQNHFYKLDKILKKED